MSDFAHIFGYRHVVGVPSCSASEPTPALTVAEHAAIQALARAWNAIVGVIGDGPSRSGDLAEACSHVHALQHAVMAQAAARSYPALYRLLGEML